MPRCPHFGFDSTACGGCQWQHIDYAAQLRYKTAIVREQLQRLGRVLDPPVRDIIPSPAIWQYRNHAQFHLTADGRPGFQAARSHRVVAIDECHVIEPPLAEWLRLNRRADGAGRSRERAVWHASRRSVERRGRVSPSRTPRCACPARVSFRSTPL